MLGAWLLDFAWYLVPGWFFCVGEGGARGGGGWCGVWVGKGVLKATTTSNCARSLVHAYSAAGWQLEYQLLTSTHS